MGYYFRLWQITLKHTRKNIYESDCIHNIRMANSRISDMLRSVLTSKLTDKKVVFGFAEEKEEDYSHLRK